MTASWRPPQWVLDLASLSPASRPSRRGKPSIGRTRTPGRSPARAGADRPAAEMPPPGAAGRSPAKAGAASARRHCCGPRPHGPTASPVLTARGIEPRAPWAHACLLELLTPLRRLPRRAARPGRRARGRSRLGPATGAANRFLVAAGTLSLLAAAAEAAPRAGAGRRRPVGRRRVRGGAAVRRAADAPRPRRVPPGPATREPSGARRARRAHVDGAVRSAACGTAGPVATGAVADRLVDRIGGNPLALLEVTARLSPDERQRRRTAARCAPARREARRRLRARPGRPLARTGAPRAAAPRRLPRRPGGPRGRGAGTVRRDPAEAALDEAEQRGVLGSATGTRWPSGTRCCGPRSGTPRRPPQRRAAHAALADTARSGDDATRVWHRAQAVDRAATTSWPSELVAARRGRARPPRVRRVVPRAGTRRGPDDGRRRGRWTGWRPPSPTPSSAATSTAPGQLAARVPGRARRRPARAAALLALGRLEEHTGSVPAARRPAREAAELADGTRADVGADRAGPRRSTGSATSPACSRDGRAHGRRRRRRRPSAGALTDWVAGAGAGSTGRGGGVAGGPLQRARDRDGVRSVPPRRAAAAPPDLLALGWLGDARQIRAVPNAERRFRIARERGALGVLVPLLSMSAAARELLGDQAGAFADAGEAAELGEHLGYAADTAVAVEMLAWQSAARGRHDEARGALERARRARPTAPGPPASRPPRHHRRLLRPVPGRPRPRPPTCWSRGSPPTAGSGPWASRSGVAPCCRGIRSPGPQRGRRRARGAVRHGQHAPRLRSTPRRWWRAAWRSPRRTTTPPSPHSSEPSAPRARTPTGSRRPGPACSTASGCAAPAGGSTPGCSCGSADEFAASDLLAWANRAAAGARRDRRHRPAPRPVPEEPLTSQETRVAAARREGQSNKEVAAALFLSPKTVEHHLGRVPQAGPPFPRRAAPGPSPCRRPASSGSRQPSRCGPARRRRPRRRPPPAAQMCTCPGSEPLAPAGAAPPGTAASGSNRIERQAATRPGAARVGLLPGRRWRPPPPTIAPHTATPARARTQPSSRRLRSPTGSAPRRCRRRCRPRPFRRRARHGLRARGAWRRATRTIETPTADDDAT